MKKTLLAILFTTVAPVFASAAPITFDLRDPLIETIDEVNSFPLTEDGLTAVFTAVAQKPLPEFPFVLNQSPSAFGIDIVGTTCAEIMEDADLLEGECASETLRIVFDRDVFLNSLLVSSFGSDEFAVAFVQTDGVSFEITSDGALSLNHVLLAAGQSFEVEPFWGDGFSFDSLTVTPVGVPEPTILVLLGTGVVVVERARRRRRM
jgi:hypothetical protein